MELGTITRNVAESGHSPWPEKMCLYRHWFSLAARGVPHDQSAQNQGTRKMTGMISVALQPRFAP